MKKHYTNIKFICLSLSVIFLFQTTLLAEPITGIITDEPNEVFL